MTSATDPRSEERRPTRSGRLLAPRPSEHVDADLRSKLGAELAAADALAARSIAATTHKSFGSHWDYFEFGYCQPRDLCALPADPAVACAHLTMLAAQVANGGLIVDAEGRPRPGRLRASSVAGRLAAINRVHRANELPASDDDTDVQAVIAGIARTFGLAPVNSKAA